jgi:hypothetical protein
MITTDLPEGLKLATFNREKLVNLWEIVRQFPSTFADGSKNPEIFINRLLAEDSIVFETSGGIILIEKLKPKVSAEFHATFWDHKLSPRTKMLKDLIIWLFMVFELERLETYVASYARAVRRFLVDKLHFVFEGRLRNAFKNQGNLHDLEIYSILKSEVLE